MPELTANAVRALIDRLRLLAGDEMGLRSGADVTVLEAADVLEALAAYARRGDEVGARLVGQLRNALQELAEERHALRRQDAVLDGQGPDDEAGRHVFVRRSTWGREGFDVGVGTLQNESFVHLSGQQVNDLRLLLGAPSTGEKPSPDAGHEDADLDAIDKRVADAQRFLALGDEIPEPTAQELFDLALDGGGSRGEALVRLWRAGRDAALAAFYSRIVEIAEPWEYGVRMPDDREYWLEEALRTLPEFRDAMEEESLGVVEIRRRRPVTPRLSRGPARRSPQNEEQNEPCSVCGNEDHLIPEHFDAIDAIPTDPSDDLSP